MKPWDWCTCGHIRAEHATEHDGPTNWPTHCEGAQCACRSFEPD